MNFSILLALVSILPQPQRVTELGGVTTNLAVRDGVGAKLRPEAYRLRVTRDGVTIWSGEKRPGFDDFKKRMAVERKWLVSKHVNCAPLGN